MMGHQKHVWAIAGLAVIGGVAACVGGSGGPFDGLEVWEPTARTNERAPTTGERGSGFAEGAPRTPEQSPRTAEPAPGAQTGGAGGGAGGLDCSGTYECREPDGDRDTVTLSQRNGECTAQGAIIHSDGRITFGGRQVGAWTATPTGFSFTTEDGTTTCTRRGSGASGGTEVTPPPSNTREPPPSTPGGPPSPGTDSPPPVGTGSPGVEPVDGG